MARSSGRNRHREPPWQVVGWPDPHEFAGLTPGLFQERWRPTGWEGTVGFWLPTSFAYNFNPKK